MKLRQLLDTVNELTPNQYSDETLVRWVSELDGRVQRELLDNYQAEPGVVLPYDQMRDMDRELLIAFPYDDAYVKYLQAQINWNNAEFERYQNAMAAYNTLVNGFLGTFSRTHKPAKNVTVKGIRTNGRY